MNQPKWRLKRTVQCAKCPWKVNTNPQEIPNGYSTKKHRKLKRTIARKGDLSELFNPQLHVMACHEEHEAHCVGWLVNQLGAGNNIALRIHCLGCENLRDVKVVGPQHERFEDTLLNENTTSAIGIIAMAAIVITAAWPHGRSNYEKATIDLRAAEAQFNAAYRSVTNTQAFVEAQQVKAKANLDESAQLLRHAQAVARQTNYQGQP